MFEVFAVSEAFAILEVFEVFAVFADFALFEDSTASAVFFDDVRLVIEASSDTVRTFIVDGDSTRV